VQGQVVVELRKLLLLPLDDLLVVTHELLNAEVSRSGLDCCLRRHGVSRLADLLPRYVRYSSVRALHRPIAASFLRAEGVGLDTFGTVAPTC
jgi:hypothetical protein